LTTKLPFDANFNKIKYLEKSKEKVVYQVGNFEIIKTEE
jgi:hypothetical protein